MAIAKMRLINIISSKKNLEDVLLKFSSLENFHPEMASKIIEKVSGLTAMNEESPYEETLHSLEAAADNLGLSLNADENYDDIDIDLDEVKAYVKSINEQSEMFARFKRELEEVDQENKDALTTLQHIEASDFSFDDLFSCRYIKIRFGRLPVDGLKQLENRKNDQSYAFISFKEDKEYSWCAYLTTLEYEGEVDNLFSSLYFERIKIPTFVHGTPDDAKRLIIEELEKDAEHIKHIDKKRLQYAKENQKKINHYYVKLKHLNETYDARKYVVGLGEQFEISGFVEEKDVAEVTAAFESIPGVRVENNPANSDKRLTPPTKLKNGWFARPFEMFVEMYGLPAYGQMDPTPFVAFTYTLLFGIMFGDLGQGILLSLVGWFAAKKMKMRLGDVGVRIGISSALFGLLYGSFFGNEEILTPFFTEVLGLNGKPIETLDASFTMTLLISTVVLGAALILISIGINTVINFKNKKLGEALFSQNGLAGFIFYGSVLAGIGLQMGMGISVMNGLYVVVLIILPLLLIFLKEPLTHKIEGKNMFPEGFGGFFVESIFELLEVCLTFVANTMSFLRIGGFVLSHAGMMLVVNVLAEMVGVSFAPLVLVLGNLFVMCLEGMIVGIQVLRLEFYEMFSRYYDGGGIEFKSLSALKE